MQPLLISLKQSATQRLLGDPHNTRELEEKDGLQRHRSTGLTLGRLALQTIRDGNSHVHFEIKVLDCHLNGGRVGELNHSRVIMKGIVTAFHQVTVDNISRFLSFLIITKALDQYFSANNYKTVKRGFGVSFGLTQIFGAAAATFCLNCSKAC
jgi:hypothetical protein